MIDSDTLADRGFAVAPGLIGPAECRALASAVARQSPASAAMSSCSATATARANTSISPIRCPSRSSALRQALYPELAAVANRWNEVLGIERALPADA